MNIPALHDSTKLIRAAKQQREELAKALDFRIDGILYGKPPLTKPVAALYKRIQAEIAAETAQTPGSTATVPGRRRGEPGRRAALRERQQSAPADAAAGENPYGQVVTHTPADGAGTAGENPYGQVVTHSSSADGASAAGGVAVDLLRTNIGNEGGGAAAPREEARNDAPAAIADDGLSADGTTPEANASNGGYFDVAPNDPDANAGNYLDIAPNDKTADGGLGAKQSKDNRPATAGAADDAEGLNIRLTPGGGGGNSGSSNA